MYIIDDRYKSGWITIADEHEPQHYINVNIESGHLMAENYSRFYGDIETLIKHALNQNKKVYKVNNLYTSLEEVKSYGTK